MLLFEKIQQSMPIKQKSAKKIIFVIIYSNWHLFTEILFHINALIQDSFSLSN